MDPDRSFRRSSLRRRSRSIAAAIGITAALVAAPAAYAQTIEPTDREYRSTLEVISQGNRGTPPTTPPASSAPSAAPGSTAGGLPFTGLDLAAMLAVAVGLAGSGLVLRRLARERSVSDGVS